MLCKVRYASTMTCSINILLVGALVNIYQSLGGFSRQQIVGIFFPENRLNTSSKLFPKETMCIEYQFLISLIKQFPDIIY